MSENILKIRDDEILRFVESSDGLKPVGEPPTWLQWEQSENLGPASLRKGIEPWLTALFQSEHLSLLVGTGLSYSLKTIATVEDSSQKETLTEGPPAKTREDLMGIPNIASEKYRDMILTSIEKWAERGHRGRANIEDAIRVMNELLRGLEILGHDKVSDPPTDENKNFNELRLALTSIIHEFAIDIGEIENSILTAESSRREEAFSYLVNFLMSFASRTGTKDRLQIFTTNYDRVIEAGAELAGLHLLDRFVGTLAPIFRSSRLDVDVHYNPPGIRGEPRYLEGVARFTKLHGSLDWIDTGTDIRRVGLPFGSVNIGNFLNAPGLIGVDSRKVMIYPNSAKDRETAEYPYVELFRDFAAALCRPNSTLVTYGYGFGDEHINRIIKDMLTIPSTHLIIISYDDADGRIMKRYEEMRRHSQISLIIGKKLAELKTLVDYFLPKPSIDRASIKMADLLRQRYSYIEQNEPSTEGTPPSIDNGGV